jgi:hypothetical protein
MEGSLRTRLLILLSVCCALVAIVYRGPISTIVTFAALGVISEPTPDLPEVCVEFETRKDTLPVTIAPSSQEPLLGLHVLHEPRTQGNTVNLIFVHGLGGSAKGTWTHSSGMFWPSLLRDDNRFDNVRVSTFGYNADFKNIARKSALGIPDFAKQLLDSLDLFYDRHGDVRKCHCYLVN